MAVVHALSHLGDRDNPSAPGQHAAVCTDCVSHAPLLVTGGAAAVVLFIALQSCLAFRPQFIVTLTGRAPRRAFRSRAPPR